MRCTVTVKSWFSSYKRSGNKPSVQATAALINALPLQSVGFYGHMPVHLFGDTD